MKNVLAVGLLVLGMTSVSMASVGFAVPEIDATTGLAAIALVGGAVMIIRGRLKK
jgi:hypothetical protein